MRIEPDAVGQPSVGHFAFFNARYADSLWKIPWLGYAMAKSPREIPAQLVTLEKNRDSGLSAYPVNQGLCLTAGRRVSLNQVVNLI